MTEETLSKKFIGAGVLVACIGFALGVTGYGYKQIKDAHFLNTDTTRIISVKGVSQMEVNSDKAILSFFLSGKGSSEESAIKAFGVLEKDMYKKLDPKIASRLEKVNIQAYHDESDVYVFYKDRSYQMILLDASQDDIESIRAALATIGVYDVTLRYTLKNPEEKYKILTDQATEKAKAAAETLAKKAGGKLGELTFAEAGRYNIETQLYEYDNAVDFFYSMPAARSEMTQFVYLTYKIK